MQHRLLLTALALTATTAMAETSESWALMQAPDGKIWHVSTVADMLNKGNEYYNDYVYQQLAVTVQNASHEQCGQFTIDVTGLNANAVEVFGPITQHLFNADDQYEICAEIHIPGNASNGYTGRYIFRAYSLDGTLLMEADGNAMILANEGCERLVFSHQEPGQLWGTTVYDIYQCAADGQGIELGHSFSLDNANTEYMSTTAFTAVWLSDGVHYLVSHYLKPFVLFDDNGEVRYDPVTWMPIWTPRNSFIIENYDQNYELVDQQKVPTDFPSGVMLRMMGIGSASEQDITEGYFTGDGRYNYLILCMDTNESWNDEYSFQVYAQGNEKVGTLCDHVGDFWNRLSPIPGEPDQWVFLKGDAETGEQMLTVVEVPSLQQVATIPSVLDGKIISANIERIPDEAEGYKYIIGLNEADMDAEGNILSQYGIYHKDLTVDSYLRFNMGPSAETFTPYLTPQSLDPHLFYADDAREFIFLAKLKGDDNEMHNTLFLGNETGQVLNRWTGDGTTKGEIRQVSILNYGTSQPELFISYYDWYNDHYTNEFLPLPLAAGNAIQQLSADHRSSRTYNLQGISTTAPTRGLFVRQGQKVCVGE